MARRPRWTVADIVRLEALLHQGLSYEDIAAQFSRTPKAIEQIVFKHGLATLRPNRYWNPQDRATARTMLAQGANAATIARHLGRSVAIVEHYLASLGRWI